MNKVKALWAKFKRWVYGVFVALGLAVPMLLIAAPANMSWDHPTLRTDGTPLPIEEIQETRIYCDGAFTTSAPAPEAALVVELPYGNHTCYATTVDIFGQESDPSGEVTFVLTPARPNPPVLRVN